MPTPHGTATGVLNTVNFSKVLQDATIESHPLYYKIKEAGNLRLGEGGTEIYSEIIRKSQNTVSAWNGVNPVNAVEPDLWSQPVHGWVGNIMHLEHKKWDDMANQGPSALVKHKTALLTAGAEDWIATMGTQLLADGSADPIPTMSGLPAFIKATSTYGGLDSTAAFWKANLMVGSEFATAYATNPYLYISTLIRRCQHGKNRSGNGSPDYGLTSLAAFNHFNVYAEDKWKRQIAQKSELSVGHVTVMVDGMELDWDRDLTSDIVYVLNTRFFEWYFSSKNMVEKDEDKQHNPPAMIYTWLAKHQLVCNQPRMQGKITTLGTL